MKTKEVVILGGGFAGLSAAVDLVSRGHRVTLFEKKGHLGGRAYSFRDPATGSVLDNGQHIFMGCYHSTRKFLERIGTLDQLRFQRNLTVHFAAPDRKPVSFRAWPLASPWHLLGGVARFPEFSWREKWGFLRMRKALQGDHRSLAGKTIPQWLRESGQSDHVQSVFWNLLALAAINEDPGLCSAAAFEPVLREALFSGRDGSRIGLSRVGLSELYAEPARKFIEDHGGKVFLKTAATRLHIARGQLQEIELAGGRRIAPEILIVALPFGELRKILPEAVLYQDPFFEPLRSYRSSPIVAINLWFDRDFIDRDFVGFWGTRIHWLFNKGRLLGEGAPYYSIVISGAHQELGTPARELLEMALRELTSVFPETSRSRLLHWQVMKEPEATFSPTPLTVSHRLKQKTPIHNLYLAGDWTDTGLPATIEGAVRSAETVVQMIETD
jgi:squalene-associated FAD-dependent desaturase